MVYHYGHFTNLLPIPFPSYTDRRNITAMLKQSDIHAVAGLFKAYLRELPEPLFTSVLYPKFVEGLRKWCVIHSHGYDKFDLVLIVSLII